METRMMPDPTPPMSWRTRAALIVVFAIALLAASAADAAVTPSDTDACANGARIFVGAQCDRPESAP
jgi:hypothetical protein